MRYAAWTGNTIWDSNARTDVTEAEYIEMIRLKTAVLLACALKMGAIMGNAPEADAEALYQFGINIGLAFQLQDDLLDVYGDTATFGKNIGGDILCNKKTFMLINALRLASDTQKAELNNWIGKKTFDPAEKIASVTAIYDQLRLKELSEEKIHAYYKPGNELPGLVKRRFRKVNHTERSQRPFNESASLKNETDRHTQPSVFRGF